MLKTALRHRINSYRNPIYIIYTIVGVSIFLFGQLLADSGVGTLELYLFRFFNSLPGYLTPIFILISVFGTIGFVFVATLVTLFRKHYAHSIKFLLAGVLAWIVTKWLKTYEFRQRPSEILPNVQLRENLDSVIGYPSGHAAVATALGTIAYLYTPKRFHKYITWMIVLVCVSRLFLGMHLPIDVIGGYGIIDSIAWPENSWFRRFGIVLAVVLSNVLGVLFYTHALRLKKTSPLLYKFLLADMLLSVVVSSWIFIIPYDISVNVYSSALIFIFFSLVSISCVVSYRRGNASALYYLFGTIAYFISILVQIIWTLGYLYPSLVVVNSMHIGSMLEMIFFTWALAWDYRRTREEREDTQRELIATLQSQNKEITEELNGQYWIGINQQ